MAGLENLFATDPALPQVQTTKMPEDTGKWAEILTTKLRELFPDVAPLPLSVEFRKKEDQQGTAIGAIHVVSVESGKQIAVPFVIRKFELCPLDIWMEMATQAVHALTPDTFKKEFFTKTPYEGLDARPADAAGNYFNDPSLWTTNYPPLQGRYSYASAGYGLLDLISDSMTEEDVENFRQMLVKHATALPKFEKHGHKEILQKIAALKGKAKKKVDSNDFAASALKLIPTSVASIKKQGPDRYSIISAADQLFDLAASEDICFSQAEARAWLSKITGHAENFMNEVDQDGEKMLIMSKAPEKGVFLFDDMKDKPEQANEFAVYHVKMKDGIGLTGIVIPHVIDFSGKKKGVKLFISPEMGTMQTSIAGVKKIDSAEFMKELMKPHSARVGQTGCFLFVDDGKAIATEPVTIKAIEQYGPMTAMKLDGTKIRISRGYASVPTTPNKVSKGKESSLRDGTKVTYLDVHGMIEQRPNEFVIPRSMMWLPMEGFREISESPNEYMMKEAALQMSENPLTIRYTGIVYEIDGNGISKVATDERRMKVLLASLGCDHEKIATVVKALKMKHRARLHGLKPMKKAAEITKVAEDTYRSLEKICDELRGSDILIKVAAEMEDASTVDKILSLGFLTPDNLAKFISYRPIFEKVIDYLAELTLASRIGMRDVSESACVIAMSKLREVYEGLRRLETMIKKPTEKTAAAKPEPKKDSKKKKPALGTAKLIAAIA